MQYPPQQQPQAPAEIYMPEQPPVYTPQSQPPVPGQDIAIYPNRRQTIWRTVICGACLVFLVLVLILSFTTGSSFQASDTGSLIIILAGIALVGWLTWRMVSQLLLSRNPILVINREGITIAKMPALSGAFISWGEIETIYVHRYLFYKYLCIRPKNTDQYLARFNGLKQFNMRINSMTGAPINIPQIYLDQPVEEILQRLYHMYASELSYYHVQLRS